MLRHSFRKSWRCCAILGAWLAGGEAALAVVLPPLDSSSPFAEYGLGFSQNHLYLHTGDSIYRLGQDAGGNDEWQLRFSGIESAFAGGLRGFEGDFATSPNHGTAAISMGFTDGGVLHVDLNSGATVEISTLDTANIFSLAGSPDGSFAGMNAFFDTTTFTFNATQIVAIDPVTATHDVLKQELAPGEFSGGLVFDELGNLYISTFRSIFPSGEATFYFISAADLQSPSPAVVELGTAPTNGANSLAVNSDGDLFFGSQTGIGVLRAGATIAETFFGDLTEDIFAGPTNFNITGGLAIDPLTDELLFIDRSGQTADLTRLVTVTQTAPVPEPTAMFTLGLAALVFTRRSRGTTDHRKCVARTNDDRASQRTFDGH